jgi:hypothetical protein
MTWELSVGANAVEDTLKNARELITEQLGEKESEVEVAGELRRRRPAAVGGGDFAR